jgi:hypothetical protein
MIRRPSARALVVVMVTAAIAWSSAWSANAQLGGLLGGTTTTTARPTTTTAPPTTTTSAPRPTTTAAPAAPSAPSTPSEPERGSEPEGPGAPESPASPGTADASDPAPTTGPDGAPGAPPAGDPGAGPARSAGGPTAGGAGADPLPPASDDGEVPPPGAGAFPPHLQALMDSIERTGARNTQALIGALVPLAEYGLSPEQAAVVGFGRFPVAGEATYSHDWWFPRFGPGWRLHQGTDIFAARGTPVRAPVSGSVRIRNGGLGGLSVYVTGADGTYYYLAHLAGIAPGLVDGATVRTGDVVGYVGDSGNARGGLPHVHFEVHPGGGGPVDPKPVLDRYLDDAIAAAPDVVAAYAEADASGRGRPVVPEPRAVDAAAMDAMRSALLWVTSVNPSGGAAQLAQAEALRAGGQIDWGQVGGQARIAERERAEAARQVDAWLRPLMPPLVAAVLA